MAGSDLELERTKWDEATKIIPDQVKALNTYIRKMELAFVQDFGNYSSEAFTYWKRAEEKLRDIHTLMVFGPQKKQPKEDIVEDSGEPGCDTPCGADLHE